MTTTFLLAVFGIWLLASVATIGGACLLDRRVVRQQQRNASRGQSDDR